MKSIAKYSNIKCCISQILADGRREPAVLAQKRGSGFWHDPCNGIYVRVDLKRTASFHPLETPDPDTAGPTPSDRSGNPDRETCRSIDRPQGPDFPAGPLHSVKWTLCRRPEKRGRAWRCGLAILTSFSFFAHERR